MGVLGRCYEVGQILDIDGVATDAVCTLRSLCFSTDNTSAWRWWCSDGERGVESYAFV